MDGGDGFRDTDGVFVVVPVTLLVRVAVVVCVLEGCAVRVTVNVMVADTVTDCFKDGDGDEDGDDMVEADGDFVPDTLAALVRVDDMALGDHARESPRVRVDPNVDVGEGDASGPPDTESVTAGVLEETAAGSPFTSMTAN